VIGGIIGGVLSGIPLLNLLNCCFCMLNLAGAAIGLSMYLREHPGESISSGDAAISGTISGAVTGVIAATLGIVVQIALGSLIASMLGTMPHEVRVAFARQAGSGYAFAAVPVYAGFGALGGFLSMQLFFKDRLKG